MVSNRNGPRDAFCGGVCFGRITSKPKSTVRASLVPHPAVFQVRIVIFFRPSVKEA